MKIVPAALVCALILLSGCAPLRDAVTLWPAGGAPDDTTPVFHTEGAAILTPEGQPFTARGVNLQYGDSPGLKYPSIAVIASLHANIVRLELRRNTTAGQLKTALDQFAALKLPVMVMYWEQDITCGTDPAILRHDTKTLWLKRWRKVLQSSQYQPYLMLNLANEWGTAKDGYREYLRTYTTLIRHMRRAGYRVPIVIDAAECGQDSGSFLDGRGTQLQAADPLHNLIVSVHAYNKPWNSPARIMQNINALKATGLPFMIGEFGDRELLEDGGNRVDHLWLMQAAREGGIGWIAWSWKGNGAASRILDMSKSYTAPDLTRRGQEIVDAINR